jgi:hypothetical protein
MCPNCRNTLSVVPSDPPDADDGRTLAPNLSAIGEPPFFLYCSFCRWDSAEVDVTFDKPTGLAGESRSPVLPFIFLNFSILTCYYYPQLNYRSSRTLRPTHLNSSVLKSTLSLSYVHPLPPPASLATHTPLIRTLPRSILSMPQRHLHWHAKFQVLESTLLLRAAGATRARGMNFTSIAVVSRLGAQRRAPTWISCGDWRKCRR